VVPPQLAPVTATAPSGAFFGDRSLLSEECRHWAVAPSCTLVALGLDWSDRAAAALLAAAGHAAESGNRLVLLHFGAGGTSLVATLAREEPALSCTTVEAAPTAAALRTAAGILAARPCGPAELSIDGSGRVWTPRWAEVTERPVAEAPLTPDQTVLISGGLGGIGRALARRLYRRFGVRLVLVDDVSPDSPGADGLRAGGVPFVHVVADVADRDRLADALGSGPVDVLIHCAGIVAGGRVLELDTAALDQLIRPKAYGLRALLETVTPGRTLAFGSVLARLPHPGVGAYALANELLRRAGDGDPKAGVLTAEWSIWDDVGIAAETGAVKVARRAGYTPIPAEHGLRMVETLLGWSRTESSVLVSSRPPSGRSAVDGSTTRQT
jgi:enediyne polyketide synthase